MRDVGQTKGQSPGAFQEQVTDVLTKQAPRSSAPACAMCVWAGLRGLLKQKKIVTA